MWFEGERPSHTCEGCQRSLDNRHRGFCQTSNFAPEPEPHLPWIGLSSKHARHIWLCQELFNNNAMQGLDLLPKKSSHGIYHRLVTIAKDSRCHRAVYSLTAAALIKPSTQRLRFICRAHPKNRQQFGCDLSIPTPFFNLMFELAGITPTVGVQMSFMIGRQRIQQSRLAQQIEQSDIGAPKTNNDVRHGRADGTWKVLAQLST